MKFTDTGKDFEQPPVGTFVARCVKVIDLGTQRDEYQGKVNIRRQVVIGWELPTELMTEGDFAGKPFICSRFYTASLSERANLRKDLENWRGRPFTADELNGFESKNILDKPCMLQLAKNDKGKVRVTGIMALPKGMQVAPRSVDITYFSLDEFKKEVFDKLAEGYRKIIEQSPEYKAIINPPVDRPHDDDVPPGRFDDMDDDIPF